MTSLTEGALRGDRRDKDGNLAKALEFDKIKDPSLIMSIDDEEIGDLKINRNTKILLANTRNA